MSSPEKIEKHLKEYAEPDFRFPSPFEFKAREDSLRAAKVKAEKADHQKTAFLANVSHEIRSPLNGILGVVSIMLDNEKEARELMVSPNEEFLHLIRKSGQFLLHMVNDILDFSKIEANLLEIQRVPYSLADLDLHLRAYLKTQLLARGFSTVKPQQLFTDPIRLEQIFNNLLGNALKFTPSPGTLEYGALLRTSPEKAAPELVFFVRDTGIGIASQKQTLIFERFQQVNQCAEGVQTGTGLGLAITKSLVELLGGKFWLESVPYAGSTFFFSHPLEVPPAPSPIPLNLEKSATTKDRSLSVLLVDDNGINLCVAETMLRKAGCQVVTATDGQQAVELFKKHSFDEILMDVEMPAMNGLTAMRIIRDIGEKGGQYRTPIIALTANTMPGDMELYLGMGFDGYLSKPFSKECLLQMLQKAKSRQA